MLKTKEFKNKTVATVHGNVDFDADGVGNSNEKAEKLLATFKEFWFLDREKETADTDTDTEKKEEVVEDKKPVKKTTTRKPRATAKKETDK